LVITPELKGWILKGDFVEFQRSGPYVERQMSSSLLRYNAYTGIRNAGVIRISSIEGRFSLSKMRVALDYLRARLAGVGGEPVESAKAEPITIPLPVRREFGRMAAVKVLAWIGTDGYPCLAPALSLQPAGEKRLVGWLGGRDRPRPLAGALVASNILTFEAISYQAKGLWLGEGSSGALYVKEVYAGGPPYPGGRVA
jgi:hypothetical protein